MNSVTLPRILKDIDTLPHQQAISIVMPFEPKMTPGEELKRSLRVALEQVQQKVMAGDQNELNGLVLQKLRNLVKGLNYSTYKKSIAIYVSPVFEKVLYLDIPVEMRITVNETLDIRNLVLAKKELCQYLVLVIDESCSSIYLGKNANLAKIKSNIPYANLYAPENHNGTRSPADNVLSAEDGRLNGLMHASDQGLTEMLTSYPLPVFAVGPTEIIDRFKRITTNSRNILEFRYTDPGFQSEAELSNLMQPFVADWKRLKKKYLNQQLDNATHDHKLAEGIGNIWKMASANRGRILIVESDYKYSAQLLEDKDGLYTSKEAYRVYSHINDTVDEVIEIVLENGGDVEFVKKEQLSNRNHIVLIQR